MAKEERFKMASFGGYDKIAVDEYISKMEEQHKQDVDDLKQTISKLSETVKSLQLVKDSMNSESNQAIENMQKYNESLQLELEKAKRKLEEKEENSKSYTDKMEIISRTLVETNERCDFLLKDAQRRSEQIIAAAKEESDRIISGADAQSNRMIQDAREKVVSIRGSIRNECESINVYMDNLMKSVEGVISACNETKNITDRALNGISNMRPETVVVPDLEEEGIPQISIEQV